MCLRKWLVTAGMIVAVSTVAPRTASADWIFTPFVGWNFKGAADVVSAGGTFSDEFEKKINYGFSLAGMGAGALGFEIDFGYSPNFFEGGTLGTGFDLVNDSNVTTLTANAIIGIPIGGQSGAGIRPYVVGGVGLIRSNLGDAGDFFDVQSKNDFGFDVGGGVMGFFNSNVGIRGDIRYFRNIGDDEPDNEFDLDFGSFDFWRGTAGLSITF